MIKTEKGNKMKKLIIMDSITEAQFLNELKEAKINEKIIFEEGDKLTEWNIENSFSEIKNIINNIATLSKKIDNNNLFKFFQRRKTNKIFPTNVLGKENTIYSFENKPIFLQIPINDIFITDIGNMYQKLCNDFEIKNMDNIVSIKEKEKEKVGNWKSFIANTHNEISSIIKGYKKKDIMIIPKNDWFLVLMDTTNDRKIYECNKWIRNIFNNEKINFSFWSDLFRELQCFTNITKDTKSIYFANGSLTVRLSDHKSDGKYKFEYTKKHGLELIMDIQFSEIKSTYFLFYSMIMFLQLGSKLKKFDMKNIECQKSIKQVLGDTLFSN